MMREKSAKAGQKPGTNNEDPFKTGKTEENDDEKAFRD